MIRQVRSSEFWQTVTLPELERVRQELRTIIHHRDKTVSPPQPAKILDITEDTGQIETAARSSSMTSVDMKVYEQQVEAALKDLFDSEPVLKKIRRGEAVTETELQGLTALILTQNPDVRLDVLQEFYPEAGSLDTILRGIIGMEPDAVKARFEQFVHKHPKLTAKQTRFLSLLENHLAKYGKVEIERLYEDPFTMVDSDGIDGVFPDAEADELIRIIESFNQPTRV